ncbi:hypothetical protein Fleli_2901 [Bernardetia litoralis DSM 6794]|uniref:DNA primase n=1 Tax=Bernardetia litoralis (strain ATCC 23117 / DSM 6794 / NBRC 15988 / NCIMB 1366 / Fx l1 / Sio-4) TaxID=880071 RepID=I4AMR6_BERLS|nr:hypothetical protein [Bernardetia litoralis]AFM05251.1 hypothetical protein Fleli_2901 [Bernardetia litoralis DSM 6794]
MNKARIITDFEKLNSDLQEQIKLVYPEGYSQHLIKFQNKDNQTVSALRFETDEKIYLVRMSIATALQLIEDDDDFDDEGYLKEEVKSEYEDEHAEVDYLSENDNYEE